MSLATQPLWAAAAASSPAEATSSVPSLTRMVSDYINHIIPNDESMKVLLVDEATLPSISMAFTQTALLSRGVFLVDRIDRHRVNHSIKTMRCVMYVRPDAANIEAMCAELRMAKYSAYDIVLCGPISRDQMDRLASADAHALVQKVEEVYCDYCPVNHDVFLMEPLRRMGGVGSVGGTSSNDEVLRIATGLASLMIAQRQKPFIRYQGSSHTAHRVATELMRILRSDPELYNYRNRSTTYLLLDRTSDPITPLLLPWTYQAMLHEHIGLDHNTLRLPRTNVGSTGGGSLDDDNEEGYVFSQGEDSFFAANMYADWGEVCSTVKAHVERYRAMANIPDRSTATLEELKNYLQKMPETKSLAASVMKHAAATTYLSSLIQRRHLLEVALLEQNMVATSDANGHLSRLQDLAAKNIQIMDLQRLCLIYHMRYEGAGKASRVAPLLHKHHCADILRKLRMYFGSDRNTESLFAETGMMASLAKTFGDDAAGSSYTQHEPVMKETLRQIFSGKLDEMSHPYCTDTSTDKPREVVVFMCGGFTYEEAALAHHINSGTAYKANDVAQFPAGGARVLLGEMQH